MRLLIKIATVLTLVIAASALAQAPSVPSGTNAPIEHADYGNPENWLCRPGQQDACALPLDSSVVAPDGSITVEAFEPDPDPAIDCFYIYPTVSNDFYSNSDLLPGVEERNVIKSQFARFAAACRLYAPMYRQITLPQIRAQMSGGPQPPKRGAAGQGSADIADAWDHYLQHDNNGRGVIVIGHSQGAAMVTGLLKSKIEGKPVQQQLVAAYVIGLEVTVAKGKDVGGTFNSIPVCKSATQTGCVLAYGTYRDTMPPPASGFTVGTSRVNDQQDGVCTNPAEMAGNNGVAHSYWSVEAPSNPSLKPPLRWSNKEVLYTSFASTPGLVTAKCVVKNGKSFLELQVNANPNDRRAQDIYGDVMTPEGDVNPIWGLHNIDMNVMMGNLINIVKVQGKSYLANR